MNTRTDIGFFTWGIDNPASNMTGRKMTTDAYAHSVFTGTPASADPSFFLLDPLFTSGAQLGKVGASYPINTNLPAGSAAGHDLVRFAFGHDVGRPFRGAIWTGLGTPVGTIMSGMDLKSCVEHYGGIAVIRGNETVRSWNGIQYQAGLSAKNVNVKHLSMNVATVPPGGVAYAHVHVGFEVMLYILSGRVRHEFGDRLTQSVENGAGDFIYIEPGVPHEVFNLSDTEPVVAVVARSDADEWAHIAAYDRTTGLMGDVVDS